MKGDFTRDTFDAARHFSRVLMQQGRVQLDADFNEQAAILLHYLRSLAADLIGPYGGPGTDHGFEISSSGSDGDFTIGSGRYYVDGILCENDDAIRYSAQRGLSDRRLPEASGSYLVYLDVWERHLTFVQDRWIRDGALGEADTCSRSQVVWQVKLFQSESSTITCSDARRWVNGLPKLSSGKMRARLRPERDEGDACSIPPEARYRGPENHLYRIEVHRGGIGWDGTVNRTTGASAGNIDRAATFKWSRDNGSVVFPIIRQQGSVSTLQSLGRDRRTTLQVGDWVEILDDDLELSGRPGVLAQVAAPPDPVEMTVTLSLPPGAGTSTWPEYNETSLNHPLLRRWDHGAIAGPAMSGGAVAIRESDTTEDGWIEIEHGIEVQFVGGGQSGTEAYRTGDYWLAPARVAAGKLDWPPDVDDRGRIRTDTAGCEIPQAEPPNGVKHHYAPLAIIKDRAVPENGDCRCSFKPLCQEREE